MPHVRLLARRMVCRTRSAVRQRFALSTAKRSSSVARPAACLNLVQLREHVDRPRSLRPWSRASVAQSFGQRGVGVDARVRRGRELRGFDLHPGVETPGDDPQKLAVTVVPGFDDVRRSAARRRCLRETAIPSCSTSPISGCATSVHEPPRRALVGGRVPCRSVVARRVTRRPRPARRWSGSPSREAHRGRATSRTVCSSSPECRQVLRQQLDQPGRQMVRAVPITDKPVVAHERPRVEAVAQEPAEEHHVAPGRVPQRVPGTSCRLDRAFEHGRGNCPHLGARTGAGAPRALHRSSFHSADRSRR